jgi:hypothetical protein
MSTKIEEALTDKELRSAATGNEMTLVLCYYAGQIDPELSKRYTLQETRHNIIEKGVYGPWE